MSQENYASYPLAAFLGAVSAFLNECFYLHVVNKEEHDINMDMEISLDQQHDTIVKRWFATIVLLSFNSNKFNK